MKAIGDAEVVLRGKSVGMAKSQKEPRGLVGIAKPKSTQRIGSVAKVVAKSVKTGLDMSLSQSKLLKLEHEITRIRDRISDIEFEITQSSVTTKGDLQKERRRAIDKLRHLQDDLYRLKVDNINNFLDNWCETNYYI